MELQLRWPDYCNPGQQSSSLERLVLKDSFFDQKPLCVNAPLLQAESAS
jgi:hypothetical protein